MSCILKIPKILRRKSSKSSIFLKSYPQKVDQNPPHYTGEIEIQDNSGILFYPPAVHPAQEKHPHSGPGQKSRHHRARSDNSLKIKLGDHDRRRTVRNKTDQPGDQFTHDRNIKYETGQTFLTNPSNQYVQQNCDQKYKKYNLQRMPDSRRKNRSHTSYGYFYSVSLCGEVCDTKNPGKIR